MNNPRPPEIALTDEWQELPDGWAVGEAGAEYRMDMQSGKNYARRPPANALLAAALDYAARGLYIIPNYDVVSSGNGKCSCCGVRPQCDNPGKHPRITDYYNKSSTDPDTIREWWDMWPAANVGIDCGRSGLLIVDPDIHDGLPGLETWAVLVDKYQIDTHTPTVRTGTGGRHVWYRQPAGLELHNSDLGPGVHTRGYGGQVIAPPSCNSGGAYTWVISLDNAPIVTLPTSLVYLLAKPARTALRPSNGHTSEPGSDYVQAALDAVRTAPEGTRNNTLYKAAALLGNYAGAGAVDRDEAAEHLATAALAAGLGEIETAKTIGSGLKKGEKSPRVPPPPEPEWPPDLPEAGPAEPAESRLTDTANGERLATRYGDRLRHVGAWGWLVWDGRRWARDDTGELDRLAKDTARSVYGEAASAPNDKAAEKMAAWARVSLSRTKLDAMISLAQSEASIAARPSDFDANPWILNCSNGAVDLRTGELRTHARDDHLTHLAPMSFDPAAACDLWQEFLYRIFDNDTQLIDFFQRAAGYSLTGDTSEQCWFLCYGTGANGK